MVSREQREFSEQLDAALAAGIARCAATTSEAVNKSHLTYWKIFCEKIGRKESWTGEMQERRGDWVEMQQQEEALLLKFTWFVATCPRDRRKITKGDNNSVAYALQVTSSVRAWAERAVGRQIGTAGSANKRNARTRAVVATLVREGPLTVPARRPVMRRELLRLRQDLDLLGLAMDQVFWAISLCLYFGMLRVEDLLGDEPKNGEGWVPRRRTHRGRLTRKTEVEGTHHVVLELTLKPNKTDQGGQRDRRKLFVVDLENRQFSAGVALLEMFRGDDELGNQERVPLFRHPVSKEEITPAKFNGELKRRLLAAGLREFAHGGHSIRIGSATAVADGEGDAVAHEEGGWRSAGMRRRYIHDSIGRRVRTQLRLARDDGPLMEADSVPQWRSR